MPRSYRRAVAAAAGTAVRAPRSPRRAGRPDLAARLRSRARALRARLDRRDAFIEALREANASQDPHQVAEWIVRQGQGWFSAPCWVVVGYDIDGQANVLAESGFTPGLAPSLWSVANWVMRHGAECFSSDLQTDSRGGAGAVGSAIGFPLSARSRTIGVLVCLDEQPSTGTLSIGPSLLMSITAVLEPSAIALDNAVSLQRAEALSVTDDLTRLHNTRFLNQMLRQETKRAVRNGSPLSLLFLDLDSFKQVNDQHGHLAGSKVLVEAAGVIRSCARETDVVARFGGDEFALVLPDTSVEGALSVAERIRDRLRETRFLASDGLAVHQTASIGVSTLRRNAMESAEALLKAADMAMYRVKAAGKDGIHVAREDS